MGRGLSTRQALRLAPAPTTPKVCPCTPASRSLTLQPESCPVGSPLYHDVPDSILELAGEAAAHALEDFEADFEAAEDRHARKRHWKRARAGAMLSLLRDHYHRTIICFDRHTRSERKALKREIEARLPDKLANRKNAVAELRRLRELVRLINNPDDVEAVLERARVERLCRDLFAPFGSGKVLVADPAPDLGTDEPLPLAEQMRNTLSLCDGQNLQA